MATRRAFLALTKANPSLARSRFSFILSRPLSTSSNRFLPKYTELRLPALSPTMETGNILEWQLREGQEFSDSDELAQVETDKATVTWEMAGDEGFIAKLFLPEGSKNVKVNSLVGVFVESEDDVAAFKNVTLEQLEGGSSGAVEEAPAATPAATMTAPAASPSKSYPTHTVLELPALSPTMQTGTVLEWHKKVGDEIEEGDAIAEIETDKASMTWEAVTEEGFIAKIFISGGSKDVPVRAPVMVLVKNQGDIAAFADFEPGTSSGLGSGEEGSSSEQDTPPPSFSPAAAAAAPLPAASTKIAQTSSDSRLKISPLARQLVNRENLDLSSLRENAIPTGPDGRLREQDVHLYIQRLKGGEFQEVSAASDSAGSLSSGAAAGGATPVVVQQGVQEVPTVVSEARSDRNWTLESKQTIPHYYLTSDINLESCDELISTLNNLSKGANISRQDVILKATALACKKIPDANSQWRVEENIIRQVLTVNIELSNDNHIYNVNNLGLSDINSRAEAEAHRDAGEPSFSVYSFLDSTISSAGSIIKPGQACSLTVGGTRKELVIDEATNLPKAVNVTSVTLSCDHRLVDGAVGAEWLKWFKIYMEEPMMMLM